MHWVRLNVFRLEGNGEAIAMGLHVWEQLLWLLPNLPPFIEEPGREYGFCDVIARVRR